MNSELDSSGGDQRRRTIDVVNASLARRYASERRFRLVGRLAVLLGLAFVAVLFVSIFANGYSGFQQTYLRLHIA